MLQSNMTYNSEVLFCLVGFGLASFKLAVVSIVCVLIYQLKQRNIDYLEIGLKTWEGKSDCDSVACQSSS